MHPEAIFDKLSKMKARAVGRVGSNSRRRIVTNEN
jgi:hypothetical protein